jgi:FKBP-type peptidyl-prolyl cis-trans isomerase 2
MQAKKGDTVKVHYKAKSQDSLIFDSSTQPEPLELVIGKKQVIPAFEKALIGMGIGALMLYAAWALVAHLLTSSPL